jgi:hypothetical protein
MGEACNTQQNYVECIENINCERRLRDLTIGRLIILKSILMKRCVCMCVKSLNTETSGFVKAREFLDQLSDCNHLNTNYTSFS